MLFRTPIALALLVGGAALAGGCSDPGPPPETKVFLTEPFTIDRIYRSMNGPISNTKLTLLDADPPELLWVTGYRAEITAADGETPRSQQYMCHSQLRSPPKFGATSFELFTLAQGQLQVDLPRGFGIPVMSNQSIQLLSQVLNLHQQSGREEIRQKTSIEFLRQSELEEPLEPLFVRAPFVMVSLEGKPLPFGVPDTAASQLHQDASCLPGEDATGTKQNVYKDRFGRSFSGHFVVPPGRHEYRTLATGQLKLQYDTTIHYIAAHLHPFAEYVELRDLTTGQTVHRADAHNLDSGIGLREVEFFSSREGLPLYRDHEYEVVVVYDNTSGQKQDGMAVMFLYLHNKAFEPPTPAHALAPPAGLEPAT